MTNDHEERIARLERDLAEVGRKTERVWDWMQERTWAEMSPSARRQFTREKRRAQRRADRAERGYQSAWAEFRSELSGFLALFRRDDR